MSEEQLRLRLQVIDLQPRLIDISVPRYLDSINLSQRIVRDAGLQSHWPSGYRRNYFFRARGRQVHPQETLADVGVVDGELVYLLPEPDPVLGLIEQNPEFPEVKPYLGQGLGLLVGYLVAILLWSFAWGMALTLSSHFLVTILPSLGLGVLTVAFSRHAWGGRGSEPRVALTALIMFAIALVPPFFAPITQMGVSLRAFFPILFPGVVIGIAGLIISWLAWWGAVEPLKRQVVIEQKKESAVLLNNCGVCTNPIAVEHEASVPFQCPVCSPRRFHVGCMNAKITEFKGDKRLCPVCNTRLY